MVKVFETGIFVDYLHTLCNIITIWSCFLGSLDQLTVDGSRNLLVMQNKLSPVKMIGKKRFRELSEKHLEKSSDDGCVCAAVKCLPIVLGEKVSKWAKLLSHLVDISSHPLNLGFIPRNSVESVRFKIILFRLKLLNGLPHYWRDRYYLPCGRLKLGRNRYLI